MLQVFLDNTAVLILSTIAMLRVLQSQIKYLLYHTLVNRCQGMTQTTKKIDKTKPMLTAYVLLTAESLLFLTRFSITTCYRAADAKSTK